MELGQHYPIALLPVTGVRSDDSCGRLDWEQGVITPLASFVLTVYTGKLLCFMACGCISSCSSSST